MMAVNSEYKACLMEAQRAQQARDSVVVVVAPTAPPRLPVGMEQAWVAERLPWVKEK